MKTRWIAGILAFAAFTGLMTGCAGKDKNVGDNGDTNAPGVQNQNGQNGDDGAANDAGNTFIITLHPEDAPISCENFENLVKAGFYDGVTFHRVVDDFMAQGGDPEGTGMGGSENTIKGEFLNNGVENNLKHVRGTVSMARSMNPDSASSQFFICYTTCDYLDGNYAAFGEVTEGMAVVDNFLKVERSMGGDGAISSPNKPIVMEKVEMIDADESGNPRVQVTMNDFLS